MRTIFIVIVTLFFSCVSQSERKKSKKEDSLNSIINIIEKEVDFNNQEISESFSIELQEPGKYKYVKDIPVPKGYKRMDSEDKTEEEYFRNLELKTEDYLVYLFNGELKANQNAQFAVLKIDVGTKDLQQCADAVMRLRGEYLYSQKKYSDIHFNFLSDGKPRYFKDYSAGNFSHEKFRKYMDYIFSYANTGSLKDELKKVIPLESIQIGNVFIQKGSPYGHAVTVMDIAKNEQTGQIIFMLSQSYMPAQDIHILVNPENPEISPWYELKASGYLETPEWTFNMTDLMKF